MLYPIRLRYLSEILYHRSHVVTVESRLLNPVSLLLVNRLVRSIPVQHTSHHRNQTMPILAMPFATIVALPSRTYTLRHTTSPTYRIRRELDLAQIHRLFELLRRLVSGHRTMKQLIVFRPPIAPTTPTPLPPLQCILLQNLLVPQLASTLIPIRLHRLPPLDILLSESLRNPPGQHAITRTLAGHRHSKYLFGISCTTDHTNRLRGCETRTSTICARRYNHGTATAARCTANRRTVRYLLGLRLDSLIFQNLLVRLLIGLASIA